MTEETNLPKEEVSAKKAAPGKRRGRKPGSTKKPKALLMEREDRPSGEQAVEAPVGRPYQSRRGWPTNKAFKCKIYGDTNELGSTVSFQLGDSTKIFAVRGVEVVLPWDCKTLMDDAVVEKPICRWKNGIPEMGSELFSRFKYEFIKECTWEEYEAFRAEQNKLPWKDGDK